MLGTDVLVFELAGLFEGCVHEFVQTGADEGVATTDLGTALDVVKEQSAKLTDVGAYLAQNSYSNAITLA